MNKNRFVKPVVLAAGFLFLGAVPGPATAQGNPPSAGSGPLAASPGAQQKNGSRQTDIFAGLTFTDDQKVEIDQIRQNSKSRFDAVVNDKKLSPDEKEAFFAGFRRMENSEIYNVLTPEQQEEVSKRIHARHATAQQQPPTKKPAPVPQ